jgi:Fur family ferric uptake transcriptional regulator
MGVARASAERGQNRGAGDGLGQADLRKLKDRFAGYAQREGLKATRQRDLIVDTFLRTKGHISIDDLLARVRRRDERVGYATVYRTLRLLADAGLAEERHFEGRADKGRTRYEVIGGEREHHDHLICVDCGLILEFENDAIERLQDEAAQRLGGFKVVSHKLELYGRCPKKQGIPGGDCPNERDPR